MPTKEEKKTFLLVDLPDYDYSTGLACRTCLQPVARGRVDGRCDDCKKDKKVLPVNYQRPPKRKTEEEEEYDYS